MEQDKKKIGLVLEGGAMRGLYTAGVLDVFLENKIRFPGLIGVSAGVLHGCSYASGQLGRSIRYYRKYRSDKRFMSVWSLIHTGNIVGVQFCYHDIPESLDPYDYDAFNKSGIEFYAGCSNVVTGKPEYLKVTDMLGQVDIMRASASMPFVSRIVEYEGMKLLDGGCTDSIPVRAFQRLGYPRNVVVLTRHDGYRKKPTNPRAADVFYRKYPEFARAINDRYRVYNDTLDDIRDMESRGEVFVIRPSVELKISHMEDDMRILQKVYEIGRRDAKRKIPELKKWMSENN